MKRRIAAALMLAQAGTAFAACEIRTETDAMTDEVKRSVACANEGNFTLSVYRAVSGEIMGNFSLPETNVDVLGEPLPMYRVDKLSPVKISRGVPELGLVMAVAEPKWVNWVLHFGEGEASTGALRDLMNGTSVTFRYNLFTGGYKETTFNLAGAREMIAEVMGIPAQVDAAKAAQESAEVAARSRTFELTKAYRDEVIKGCKQSGSMSACMRKAVDCEDALNAPKMKACLVGAGLLDADFKAAGE